MDNVNTNVYVKSYINYNDLLNKPTINNVTLVGNLSLDDLGIQRILTAGAGINIDSSVISVLTDDTLSIYSENPVQNKVIKEALDAKQDSLNQIQIEAINSGITSALVAQINTNAENITALEINKLDITTAASTYLKLTGGTLTGSLTINTNNSGKISFQHNGNTIGIITAQGTATNPVIGIAGNDGAGSIIISKGSGIYLVRQNGTQGYEILATDNKAVANGVATLDANVKVPLAQLPVDSVLDATSENPVQNKVIYAAIGDIETLLHNLNSGNTIGDENEENN